MPVRRDEVRQCELTVTPLTDELGRISLHIIFFEEVEQIQPDKKPTRRVSSRRLSNIATMIFHRNSKEVPRSNLHRTHHLSQSVRHEVLPKQVVLSRRPSENIPTESNNRVSISSLFLNGPKSSPEAVDTKKGCRPNPESLQLCTRFDSTSMDTGNSVTLRSSAQTSHVSVGNEPPVKRPEIRPKSCTNAPLWPVLQSSETESTTDRVRPASAVLGARSSRYGFPSLLTRGSRLLSAPVSQTSLVLSDAGTLQLVIGKHGDPSKSHVTDTFAKILSLDKDLHEKRKLESKHMHKYTLKHYSPTRAVWDWFILILVIYTAIFTPYNAAFLLNHNQFGVEKDEASLLISWKRVFLLLSLLYVRVDASSSKSHRIELTDALQV
nr:potassium voltage gated channel subfamily H [Hymenolepis microstoma]